MIRTMPRAEYEALDAANYSTLKHFERSPAHARELLLHPPEPTEALEFGQAVHCAVLRPDDYGREYVESPGLDRRTREGKAAWAALEAEYPHATVLRAETWAEVLAIREACHAHPVAGDLLRRRGVAEQAVTWTDAETGQPCKGVVDCMAILDGWTCIVDLKTCRDASPEAFAREVAKYWYHAQAAMYLDGLAAHAPRDRRFLHLAVEKERPYCVAVYELDHDAIRAGRRRYRDWLRAWAQCRASGDWPGYQTEIYPLALPRWATGRDDE